MNKRSREILSEIINKTEYKQSISMEEIANRFHVSSRTIRYDIDQINDFLKTNHLSEVTLGKQGVILAPDDIGKAKEYLAEDDLYSYKLSKDERKLFMVILLTCENTYRTLSDMAEIMFVSRSTVIQDLEGVKEFFKSNHLYLTSHSNKGLLLEGDEEKKRGLILDIIKKNHLFFGESPVLYRLLAGLIGEVRIDAEDVEILEKIINMAEHSYGRFLTDTSFSDLKYFLLLTLYRIRLGEYVTVTKTMPNSKWDMAQGIFEHLTKYAKTEITDEEIDYLARVLNEMRYIRKTTSNNEIVKMQVITRSFIGRISKEINIPLQGDFIFYENLINHLESMFSTAIENDNLFSVVEEVVQKYPNVKKVVTKNVDVLEEYMGRSLSEVEISYIVVHICAAIERNRNERLSYSVVLVCNGGIGTSQLLLARLKKYFHFHVVNIIPAHDLINLDLEEVDIVISTVAIKGFQGEYIQVDPLLNDEDCIRVGEKLATIQVSSRYEIELNKEQKEATQSLEEIKNVLEENNNSEESIQKIKEVVQTFFNQKGELDLIQLLPEEAIALDVSCKDWKDAIRKSAEYLLKHDYIEKRYIEAMVQNVEQNGPYIVVAPGFALPHEELNAGANKVGLSLIRLKEPVVFGKENFDPVEWVCCLSAINKETHLKAMFHLVNLFHNKNFRDDIKKLTSCKGVYDTIKLYEYEMR